jgi:hypothetical protein
MVHHVYAFQARVAHDGVLDRGRCIISRDVVENNGRIAIGETVEILGAFIDQLGWTAIRSRTGLYALKLLQTWSAVESFFSAFI